MLVDVRFHLTQLPHACVCACACTCVASENQALGKAKLATDGHKLILDLFSLRARRL